MSIVVRFAQEGDADDMVSIFAEAALLQRRLSTLFWDANDIDHSYVRRLIAAGEAVIAHADGEAVGIMALQWRDLLFWPDRDDGAAGYIHRLAVRRAWAGGRVTTPLLAFADSEARARAKSFLRLDCAPLPRLCAVYERAGFARVDIVDISQLGADFRTARYERALI